MGCLSHYSPKFYYNVFLFVGLSTVGTLVNFTWIVQIISSVQMFQSLIVMYRRGNFVYHHWGCTAIKRQKSYPFRFLFEKRGGYNWFTHKIGEIVFSFMPK